MDEVPQRPTQGRRRRRAIPSACGRSWPSASSGWRSRGERDRGALHGESQRSRGDPQAPALAPKCGIARRRRGADRLAAGAPRRFPIAAKVGEGDGGRLPRRAGLARAKGGIEARPPRPSPLRRHARALPARDRGGGAAPASGVVPIYMVGEEQGIPYFAMEHVAGAASPMCCFRSRGAIPAS